ncbi:unnamed protein product [Ectocarpus sp. 13 AM-2016]
MFTGPTASDGVEGPTLLPVPSSNTICTRQVTAIFSQGRLTRARWPCVPLPPQCLHTWLMPGKRCSPCFSQAQIGESQAPRGACDKRLLRSHVKATLKKGSTFFGAPLSCLESISSIQASVVGTLTCRSTSVPVPPSLPFYLILHRRCRYR